MAREGAVVGASWESIRSESSSRCKLSLKKKCVLGSKEHIRELFRVLDIFLKNQEKSFAYENDIGKTSVEHTEDS